MIRTTGSIILLAAFAAAAFAQPEVMAWGNLTGLRVDGHLLELGFGGNFRLQNARTDPQVIDKARFPLASTSYTTVIGANP
jgi:hypothetical protein